MTSVYGFALLESMENKDRMIDENKAIAEDALREIDKLLVVVNDANRHFVAEGEANAALHLTETVLLNPLASKVAGALRDGNIARDRIWKRLMGEVEIPFDDPSN